VAANFRTGSGFGSPVDNDRYLAEMSGTAEMPGTAEMQGRLGRVKGFV
jgi:hypothetical protein